MGVTFVVGRATHSRHHHPSPWPSQTALDHGPAATAVETAVVCEIDPSVMRMCTSFLPISNHPEVRQSILTCTCTVDGER